MTTIRNNAVLRKVAAIRKQAAVIGCVTALAVVSPTAASAQAEAGSVATSPPAESDGGRQADAEPAVFRFAAAPWLKPRLSKDRRRAAVFDEARGTWVVAELDHPVLDTGVLTNSSGGLMLTTRRSAWALSRTQGRWVKLDAPKKDGRPQVHMFSDQPTVVVIGRDLHTFDDVGAKWVTLEGKLELSQASVGSYSFPGNLSAPPRGVLTVTTEDATYAYSEARAEWTRLDIVVRPLPKPPLNRAGLSLGR